MIGVDELRRKLQEKFSGNFELDVGSDKNAILSVVDDCFFGMDRAARIALVSPFLEEAGLKPALLELYSVDEAGELGVVIDVGIPKLAPVDWDEAVSMVQSGVKLDFNNKAKKKPHRIVFYSYKGGVGRTTALVQTAFHLARMGSRVVVADMDVEAPGLHVLLPKPDNSPIKFGLVDYLWERQVIPFDAVTGDGLSTCLVEVSPGKKNAISYVVEDPFSRAQINVIPAGVVGPDYVRRLRTLSYRDVASRPDDAWTMFEKELVEQLDPDILLIDARTGLGEWGGLSLLRLADEAFFVMYPSEQNIEGIQFVRQTLESLTGVTIHLVLSLVPEGVIGKNLVAKILPVLGMTGEEERLEVPYSPGIASASMYPVESAMSSYIGLANRIKETEVEETLELSIKKSDRWNIIESLKFPDRNAKSVAAEDFEIFFQKTSDFDKFLDDARWVVRGRKGTGKSTLFHLFVEHQENAKKRAHGKLENIDILPGHGPAFGARLRPTTDEFGAIHRGLKRLEADWLSLWRAYAIIRIYTSNLQPLVDLLMRPANMKPLRVQLQRFLAKSETWRSEHTTALLKLVEDPLNGLCRDLVTDINEAIGSNGRKLWLLYDDLDQDIMEEGNWQSDALAGLLRLAYDSNNQDLHNIRFKIFLREDMWNKLVFTNKSHFGDPRTLLLQWKIEDFLRLAYRLAAGGSPEFRLLAQRHFALSESDVDNASEEQLRQALAPLWGLNQEKSKNAFAARWVYSRMTDAQGNTYPRSLTVLLQAARDAELEGRNSSKPVPSNRLLSPRAMQAGLEAASIERVDALKNEYPHLRLFLEDIQTNQSLRSQFSSAELSDVWEKTSAENYPSFEAFVAQLEVSGLLMKKSGASYEYGFASLYIDGLKVTRVQGEKK